MKYLSIVSRSKKLIGTLVPKPMILSVANLPESEHGSRSESLSPLLAGHGGKEQTFRASRTDGFLRWFLGKGWIHGAGAEMDLMQFTL